MAEESSETSDDWPNALHRINETLTQMWAAAESLRFDANAGLLDVSDTFREHLLYVTSVVLQHDPSDPDWRQRRIAPPQRTSPNQADRTASCIRSVLVGSPFGAGRRYGTGGVLVALHGRPCRG